MRALLKVQVHSLLSDVAGLPNQQSRPPLKMPGEPRHSNLSEGLSKMHHTAIAILMACQNSKSEAQLSRSTRISAASPAWMLCRLGRCLVRVVVHNLKVFEHEAIDLRLHHTRQHLNQQCGS